LAEEWTSGSTGFELDLDAGTFAVTGDLDFKVEREFQQACAQLLEGEVKKLLIDLTGVTFICSSCMGSLFLLHDKAKRRGMSVCARLNGKIAPICKMMGLDELIDIEIQ
jgi:anti-anti-sigma factor